MIKFTDLAGRAFYVKSSAVLAVREPYGGEYENGGCNCVIIAAQARIGVRETIAQVMGALGMT